MRRIMCRVLRPVSGEFSFDVVSYHASDVPFGGFVGLTGYRCNVLVIIIVGCLSMWFRKKNRQADRGECVLLEDPNFRFTI